MTQQENTFAVLAKHLLGVFKPLAEAFASEEQFKGFLYRLGWNATGLPPQYVELSTAVADGIVRLEQFVATPNPSLSDMFTLVSKAKSIFDKVENITVAPPGVDAGAFLSEFSKKLVDLLLVEYFVRELPSVYGLFSAMQVIELKSIPATPQRPAYVQLLFNWEKIPHIFNDPIKIPKQLYGWGTPTFDTSPLFTHLASLLYGLGFPVNFVRPNDQVVAGYIENIDLPLSIDKRGLKMPFYYTEALGKPLEFSILFLEKPAAGGKLPGLVIQPGIPAEVPLDFRFGNFVVLKIKAGTNLATLFGLTISPDDGLKVRYPLQNADAAPGFTFGATVEFTPEQPMIIFGDPTASRFQFRGGKVGFEINSISTEVEAKLSADINELTVILSAGSGDGFLQKMLGTEEIRVDFPLGVDWSSRIGFGFRGSPNLEVALNPHLFLGPIEIPRVTIALKMPDDNSSQVRLDGGIDIKGDLGPLKFVAENLGISLRFDSKRGNLGPFDLSLGFKPPNGIGLSLDAGVVKGGGYLFFDFDREEYAGALELIFSEWIALRAIGLITTKMPDGSKGFSLLIIITVEFGSGIQLGFGFTLLGVGGILGLNRTVNIDPLSEGVRTGAIESVMFPQDVIANAPRIISDLRRFFPPVPDIFLVGPMAKIGWGTPTLVRVSLGIILEFPNVTITILGVIKVTLPDENAVVLKLQVNFIGRIEPQNKLLWFYAELFDSRVLFLTLEGGMGLLVNWGDNPNFVLSVGGFHPQYAPPPLPFPAPPRIAVNILNESYAKVRIEGYFAVTSNTVQFGARVEVFFGLSEFKIEGHFSFDALFQFDPFFFSFSLSVSFSVKVFGVGLFSVGFSGLLEGPTPWHIKGKGRISLLFFKISVPFEETWGERKNTELPPIEVFPLLEKEFHALTNWEAVLPGGNGLLVSLRKLGESTGDILVLHPVGYLRISQHKIPLDLVLEKVGNQKPSDVNKVTVSQSGGWQSLGTVQEPFAIGQFKDLDNAKKLSSPGFQNQNSGLKVSAAGDQLRTSKAVKRIIRYETVIIDTNYKRHVIRFYTYFRVGYASLYGTLFDHYLGGSAVSQSVLSKSYRKQVQPFDEVIKVQPHQYSVAFTRNNQPLHDTAMHFNSQADAEDFLQRQLQDDPNLAESLHVIPNTEMSI